ncbi:hypothetical protein CXF61_11540 [Psychrobacter sp. 4Dc]|uniref:hypothetical protein n=1 Tax=Psychrobacter sp. 4Dc TaxID=888437 RepID=UPI000CA76E51|nr:hypothetical protein [Psychrobacter sp. 4Dc]PKH64437.1 hypothetical protein CXF61_11540 [Psychrobacter sp. 4Dc]
MFLNFKAPIILSVLLISSCSQFDSNPKQEQISDAEPITGTASMIALYSGNLHFNEDCIIVRPEGEKGIQLAIPKNEVISEVTNNSLVYQGKKYTEGDYIQVSGGVVVNDVSTFKKKHNLSECDGLEVFIPN